MTRPPFDHQRRHGGASSPKLVREANELHARLCRVAARALIGRDAAHKARALRLTSRAYRRFCRREVRLELQQGDR